MKILLIFAAIVSLVAAVVELKIAKHAKSPSLQTRSIRNIEKRQDATIAESVINIKPWYEGGGFYMNVSVGTPGQIVTVAIDTIGSVTYFDAQDSSGCVPYAGNSVQQLCAGGSFQTNFSSTYKVEAANGFNYTSGNEVMASGDLAVDVIQVGDVVLNNMRFGVAEYDRWESGSIGLGYGLNYVPTTASPRLSFLEQLQAAGAINSKLYSLLLGRSDTPTGSIIFGGVDVGSFSGELTAVNFLASPTNWEGGSVMDTHNTTIEGVTQPLVAITDLGIVYENGTKLALYDNGDPTGRANNSLPSILDATTEARAVSTDVYDALAPLIPGLNATTGILPCETANEKINVTVSLGNSPPINVRLADLVIPIFNAETRVQNTTSQGSPLCVWAMYTPGGSLSYPYTLGSSVMRSMYLVFDLDNAQLNVAQAITGDCDYCGGTIAVPAGPNGVARAISSIYSTVTVVTASSNTGIREDLVSASGSATSPVPVAKTTDDAVGTAVGSAAIPSNGVAIPQTVLSSGTLSAATHATHTTSSPTTTSTSGATRSGAAAFSNGLFVGMITLLFVSISSAALALFL